MAHISSVLLDRDGTVIVDKHYLANPAGVELLPGAAAGMRALKDAGISLFIVTNQSGIGRGYFSEQEYHACHAALESLLEKEGASLTDGAFCPHGPEEGCECRKPALGMWRLLAGRNGLAAATTAMVGDKPEDVSFGRKAGFPAVVLVLTGKGSDTAAKLNLPMPAANEPYALVPQASNSGGEHLPHAVAHDLFGAAAFIVHAG
ncbi:MAG: Histidine biosynthesis bifunctional protein HisB [Desulfovibrio sp.]